MISMLPLALALASALAGCFDPSDRRPGTRLSGGLVEALPEDWSFTDGHKEIAIEVVGLFGLPHSVTIWSASLDGARSTSERATPGIGRG